MEEAHAPGDRAEEGRPLVDEVKEGQRFLVPVTFNLWHLVMHTDWMNQAGNIFEVPLIFSSGLMLLLNFIFLIA